MNHDCAICGKDILPEQPVLLDGKVFQFCHADGFFGCYTYKQQDREYPTVVHDPMNCTKCLLEKSEK